MRTVIVLAAFAAGRGAFSSVPPPSCDELDQRYEELFDTIDDYCNRAEDSEVWGGRVGCAPSIRLREGAVNGHAAAAAQGELVAAGNELRGCPEYTGCGADLGESYAECVDHHCRAEYTSCLPEPSCDDYLRWYVQGVAALDR